MIKDAQKNTNKIVWLTGSASGVGLHLTDLFQKMNYQVIATDINEEAIHNAAAEKKWNTTTTSDLLTIDEYKNYRNKLFDLSFYTQVLPMNLLMRNLKVKIFGIK